ncbi:palmitoleoyl-protein carboxylesterase NOTUM [Euwallacea fornicatus]|uniref:palmitoleoyl-protein carboxylesterase NOTUM n=1 Tax=Euwallacea fornicatus TaxID=995702 RepID=UPI00338E113E
MRAFAHQIHICFWLIVSPVFTSSLNDPIFTNAIQREIPSKIGPPFRETKPLKKVFLSNRSITCNDGSQAGFYLRKSSHSKRWIIFLEGGWYCYDHHSCRNRWIKQRHYMTSSNWPETKDVGGILSPNMQENPHWWNANHVFVPYCSSDSWSGSKKSERQGTFSFMGSSIVLQVVRDLIPLGLENSTDLLLAGSSAGGTGVMINLDFVEELLHEQLLLKKIRVKGVTDSGWFLDRTPFAPTIKPVVDAIRKGMDLWQGRVPRRCREQYLDEPWRCYFGYRIYPTLKAQLFVFQWLFDEAQMDADNVGAPVTKQQWDYIHKMGDALRHSFQNVSAVFAPSCISHSVLTKKEWQEVKIDDISIADALHCWVQKANRKRIKRRKNNKKKKLNALKRLEGVEINTRQNITVETTGNKRRRKNQRRNHRRNKNKLPNFDKQRKNNFSRTSNIIKSNNLNSVDHHTRRIPQKQRRSFNRHCVHRRLERCSWPQCNHSCPKLHNPFTGEEMDFIELLKSFGLDMESVANALGIDMETLNNMDQGELLNLLTQQSN